jgi:arginyl-tRNA synthetase
VREKTPDLNEERQREVARVLGIGSVKYFDLAQSRTSDYVFSWDKMLSMQGNIRCLSAVCQRAYPLSSAARRSSNV